MVGLAWTSLGGATLMVESIGVSGQKAGGLKLTGHLGDVMSESANIAYSYVQSYPQRGDAAEDQLLPGKHHPPPRSLGATPKDGPSAGVTMASSIIR